MKTSIIFLTVCLIAFTNCFAQKAPISAAAPIVTIEIEDDETILLWSMNKEVNTRFFVVEESLDGGNNFNPMRTVKATGNSNLPTHFEINEYGFIKKNAVYRVILVHMDGIRVASNVVKLSPKRTMLPNPSIAKK